MKKFLVGCGIVVVVVLVAGVIAAITLGPRLVRWGGDVVHKVRGEIGREQQRADAVQSWGGRGPEAPAEVLFPARVGVAVRGEIQEQAMMVELGVTRPARQATYSVAGSDIEVWAFSVNDLERDGLLTQVKAAYERSSGTKSSITLPSRASFSSTALGTSHVVTPPGWVLVFRPRGEMDVLLFIDAFFGCHRILGQPRRDWTAKFPRVQSLQAADGGGGRERTPRGAAGGAVNSSMKIWLRWLG